MRLTISLNVLESCLMGAANTYPAEFLGLLAGDYRKDEVIAEKLYLAPLSQSNENSAWFDSLNVPLSAGVVGTFHSHPNSVARPSAQDLRLFSRYGRAHLIAAGPPFTATRVAAFDSLGKPIELAITH